MTAAIVIAAVTCLGLVATVIVKPEIGIKKVSVPLYPIIPLIGAIFMIALTPLTLAECGEGMLGAGAVNPLKILVLFISVTAISVFLDEGGFFELLAKKILSKAGGSQTGLFFLLYFAVSALTVFTSNDIIILTFTPFIIYFCKKAEIGAFPYLIAEFTAANTWSMALLIGNPTNIYLATTAGIDFVTYLEYMIVPTVLSGVASAGVLYLLFAKTLSTPFERKDDEPVSYDKPMCILGVAMLAVCTVGLAISGFIGVEMWIECAICLGVLVVAAFAICAARHKKPKMIGKTFARLPYALIPFVLSMFVVSLGLEKAGVTAAIAEAFSAHELLLYGTSSYIASNLMNNIPMSMVFSSMISASDAGYAAVFASIVGSNLGALLTPIGALAGIMFSSICKKHGEKVSAFKFIRYGGCVSIVSLATSLGALQLMLIAI